VVKSGFLRGILARPERFELPTSWFVARHSIQLSYGRAALRGPGGETSCLIRLRLRDYPRKSPYIACQAAPLWRTRTTSRGRASYHISGSAQSPSRAPPVKVTAPPAKYSGIRCDWLFARTPALNSRTMM
jgi:hypothetical protein